MPENEGHVSLAEVVRGEISAMPHLKTSLAQGVINYSALARKLMPAILKKTGKTPNKESMLVAIKRFAQELNLYELSQTYLDLFAHSEITMQDNMVFVQFKKTDNVIAKLENLFEEEDWKVGEMRALIQESDQIMVMMKEDRLESVLEELSDEVLFVVKDGALLTLRVPTETFSTYGVLAEITTQIAKRGINVAGLLCTIPDIHILVDEKEAERAYSTLKSLVNKCKRAVDEKSQKSVAKSSYRK